jgi:antitoxin ParD1/3/4
MRISRASLIQIKRKAEDAVRFEALRSAVAMGIEDIEAGRFKTFDSSEVRY